MPEAKISMYFHLHEAIIKKLISKLKTDYFNKCKFSEFMQWIVLF